MIFKVDFEKACDSVRWDYLDDVLNKFGFGSKWRNWIHNCLNSFKGSILVNGSSTREFQFRKGLKQGGVASVGILVVVLALLRRLFGGVAAAVVWLCLTIVGGDGREWYSSTFYELSPSVESRWRHQDCSFHLRGRWFSDTIWEGGILPRNGVKMIKTRGTFILGARTYGRCCTGQLGNANVRQLEALYTTPKQPNSGGPKYSLMGFTWAFKGARPRPRLTPDAFEAQAEWWGSSREFFDGHIREPPRILPHVNQHSRDDVPENIYRRMLEQDKLIKEQWDKIEAHDLMINQMNSFPHGGPRMFTMQPSNAFFDGVQTTLAYSASFDQPISSWYPSLYPAASHTATPWAQQGFVLCSSTYLATVDPRYQYGPSNSCDVGGVIPEPIYAFATCYCRTKKRADKSRNKMRNDNVSDFNLGKAFVHDNAWDDEVMITGARATEDFI
nr:cysteine-rich receptor-like protein kinase [Tanacetum cinerariifolium]